MKRKPVLSQRTREGFTLLELGLVMVILVVMASFAMPMIDRVLESQKIDKGADLVRAALGQARVRAIRTGTIHAFVYRANSSGMAVMSLDDVVSKATLLNQLLDSTGNNARISDLDSGIQLLPRSVVFVYSRVLDDSRSQLAKSESEFNSGANQYVLFYPDGTCQDAQLQISSPEGKSVSIILRGLTGTSRLTSSVRNAR